MIPLFNDYINENLVDRIGDLDSILMTESVVTESIAVGKVVSIKKYNAKTNSKETVDVKVTDYIKKPGSKDFVEYELKGKKRKVAVNVFKSIMESHKYKLGDMYKKDFDYDGMLRVGAIATITMGLKKLEKLYKSFVDVNYHSGARLIDGAIDALKDGDKSTAKREMEAFRKMCSEEIGDPENMGESLKSSYKTVDLKVQGFTYTIAVSPEQREKDLGGDRYTGDPEDQLEELLRVHDLWEDGRSAAAIASDLKPGTIVDRYGNKDKKTFEKIKSLGFSVDVLRGMYDKEIERLQEGLMIPSFDEFVINEATKTFAQKGKDFKKSGKDLSYQDGSLTQRLEGFIRRMGTMDHNTMKTQMLEIVEDAPMSKAKRIQIKTNIDKKRNKNALMMYITNIYLAGSQLSTESVNESDDDMTDEV